MASSSSSSAAQSVLPPMLEEIRKTPANPQDASLFFARLPLEIRRMVYVEVWRSYGSIPAADRHDATVDAGQHRHGFSSDNSEWWWQKHGGRGLTVHIAPSHPPKPGRDPQIVDGFRSTPCFLGVDNVPDAAAPPEAHDTRFARTADAASRAGAIWLREHIREAIATETAQQQQNPGDTTYLDALTPLLEPPGPWEVPHSVWQMRKYSPWLQHWPCEAYYSGSSSRLSQQNGHNGNVDRRHVHHPPRPFLPVLQTCRRAYAEAVELLYHTLTFQFMDAETALAFVRRWPCVASVRLVFATTISGMDGHYDWFPSALPHPRPRLRPREIAGVWSRLPNSPWHQLLDCLGDPVVLPHLRRLRFWVELPASTINPPWHAVGAETTMFAPLLLASPRHHRQRDLRVALYLPALPENVAERMLPPWCYLIAVEKEGADDSGKWIVQPTVVRNVRHENVYDSPYEYY